MARKAIVGLVMIAALGLMFWSGFKEYERRKQEAAQQHPPQMVLVPDGQAPPAASATDASAQPQPMKGRPAPAFTLVDLSGKKVSLSDYRGKAVLLNFWATWCGPCKLEIPWIIKLRDQYQSQGFEVLGIESDNFDDDPKGLAAYKAGVVKSATALGINYPVLLGGDTISKPYGGLDGLPNSFYVDRNGIVTQQIVGLADRDEIEANIKKALAGNGSGNKNLASGGQ
jgi:thiol-disulfide isomerase/thioredoxin